MARLDIVIPAIEKDLGTLPFVIDGLRKNVRNSIGSIYVVSPGSSSRIKALCQSKGCKFIDEKTVLPITKKDIHYRSSKWERSGWLYQQLLKLGSSSFTHNRYYLTMDADTVLIRPHTFLSGNQTVFYTRSWSQPEYFRTYKKLMKRPVAYRSFVAHYMLFDKQKLSRMKDEIEKKHGVRWYKAIINSINKKKNYGFSEFETYGNYVYSTDRKSMILKRTLNRSFPVDAARFSATKIRKLSLKYRSLSFHKRWVYKK